MIIKNTYQKFESHLSSSNDNQYKGELFEKYVFYLLKEHFLYKENIKEVWRFNDIPASLREKFKLSQIDHGIDILIYDKSKRYIGIQVKFRKDQGKLGWSKDKLANLFAAAELDGFAIFSNCSDVDQYTRDRKKLVYTFLKEDFLKIDDSLHQNIISLINNIAPKHTFERKSPYQFQEEIIQSAFQYYASINNKRGNLILPCGSGKTLVSLWIKEKLQSKKVLVLVPSLNLLKQFKDEWIKEKSDKFDYLCVCSDRSVDSNDIDEIKLQNSEIDLSVTSKTEEIQKFLLNKNSTVIFSTYQSLHKIAAIKPKVTFDLVICDEAHRTAGLKDSPWTMVHDNKTIDSKLRLYMTATPIVASQNIKTRLEKEAKLLYDMSRKSIFGETFFTMTFKDAIEKNILSDYKIIFVKVDDKDISNLIADRQFIIEKYSIDELANNVALDKMYSEFDISHAISFHSRILKAKKFSEHQEQLSNNIDYIAHLSSKQSTALRSQMIREFSESSSGVMSNARCLNEGIDVPKIDMVFFSDPKNSKVDIVQAVGRALRTYPNKECGYIVVPAYISENDTIADAAFNNMVNVMKAMCEHDERLQVEIDDIKVGKGVRSKRNQSSKIIIDKVIPQIELLNFTNQLRDKIYFDIISYSQNTWNINFNALIDFIDKHDRYPSGVKSDEIKLYQWCSAQRVFRKKGMLSDKKIKKLNSIDFIWNQQNLIWDIKFDQLKEYIKKHGKPPSQIRHDRNLKMFDGKKILPQYEELYSLSVWVMQQRAHYKKEALSEVRIKRLRDIGFVFSAFEERFLRSYNTHMKFLKSLSKKSASERTKKDKKKITAIKTFIKHHQLSKKHTLPYQDNMIKDLLKTY
jgi:predicted helicase